MSVLSMLLSAVLFFWTLFKDWIYLFIAPLKNLDVLWIIIPVWLNCILSDFFQEKEGTSFGNAISNGVVPLWVGIDWARYITGQLSDKIIAFNLIVIVKYFICFVAIIYGGIIIIYGVKAKSFIHFIGRMREVSYFMLVFTPITYGVVQLSYKYIFGIILFFPVFYFAFELIDVYIPSPKIYQYDSGKVKEGEEPPAGSDSGRFDNSGSGFNNRF